MQAKLDEETEKKHDLLPCSFVVFRSLRASTVAVQADWVHSPLTVDVTPAPELASVLWKNLAVGLWQRCNKYIRAVICPAVLHAARPPAEAAQHGSKRRAFALPNYILIIFY